MRAKRVKNIADVLTPAVECSMEKKKKKKGNSTASSSRVDHKL